MRRVLTAVAPLVVLGCARTAPSPPGPAPASAPPLDAAPRPGEPPVELAGRRFQLVLAPGVAWDDAAASCRARGAELARLERPDLFEAVSAHVQRTPGARTIWLGGGPCADPAGATPLCWSDGAPIALDYSHAFWVRNGQGGPHTHLFLRAGRLTGNADMVPAGGVDGFLCAWPGPG